MIAPFSLSSKELLCLGAVALFLVIIFEAAALIVTFRVKKTSERFNALVKLNEAYDFYIVRDRLVFYRRVSGKAQLERFNYERCLDENIAENLDFFSLYITKVKRNRVLHESYLSDFENLPQCGGDSLIFLLRLIYRAVERRAVEKIKAHPVTEPKVEINASYESKKGEKLYKSKKVLDFETLSARCDSVSLAEEEKGTAKYRRRQMTDSLRYDILKRDGFHCVLCGRGPEDGVKLHVDHIVPVSKGGKTEPDNLRTLCRDCNEGKSDKYDPGKEN